MILNTAVLEKAIFVALEADIPLMIWGPTGMGKSTIVKNICDSYFAMLKDESVKLYVKHKHPEMFTNSHKRMNFTDLRIAYTSPEDYGIPRTVSEVREDIDTFDYTHSYTRPNWWPSSNDKDDTCFFLFLDELNRGQKYTEMCVMEMTQERTLRGRPSPTFMRLFSACNPGEGGYTSKELDAATKARWCHIHATPSKDSFAEARAHKLGDLVKLMLRDDNIKISKDFIQVEGEENDWSIYDQVHWCPRTIERFSNLEEYIFYLKENTPEVLLDSDMMMALKAMSEGLLGLAGASTWWTLFEKNVFYNLEDILNDKLPKDIDILSDNHDTFITMIINSELHDAHFAVTKDRSKQQVQKRVKSLLSILHLFKENRPDLCQSIVNSILLKRSTSLKLLTQVLLSIPEFKNLILEKENE